MKAIGNYIIVQQYEERVNDILVKENNVGIVVDGANEHGSLVGKKVIFSCGMSTLDETDQAVKWMEEEGSDFALLHCNSTYPAPLEDLNLKCIQTLKERYGCEVGYSGHEFRLGTTVASVYLGPTILERHITLDRSMWGTDQAASLSPEGMKMLGNIFSKTEKIFGNGIKQFPLEEKNMLKKFKYW